MTDLVLLREFDFWHLVAIGPIARSLPTESKEGNDRVIGKLVLDSLHGRSIIYLMRQVVIKALMRLVREGS